MKESGLRNGAHGAEKFGFKNLAAVHWNLLDTALVERAIANREGYLVQGGAFCVETGAHTGRSPKDKFVVATAQTEKTVPPRAREIPVAVRRFHRPRQGQDLVCAGSLRRRRSQIPHQHARLQRDRLALAVYPQPVDQTGARRACALRGGFHHPVAAVVQGRSETPWRAQRNRHCDRLQPAHHPDRRHLVCRRDEESGVHDAQLLSAGR